MTAEGYCKYEPTPDDIARACLAIQSTWSRTAERNRRGLTEQRPESGLKVINTSGIRSYLIESDYDPT